MKTMIRKIAFWLVIALLFTQSCTPSHTTTVACNVADLIKAIDTANTDTTPDFLELASDCVYMLTEVNTTVTTTFDGSTFEYGDVGLPPISTPITINGHNATISRAADAPDFRIFHILSTGNLTLNDLTITNGFANRPGSAFPSSGGAVYNDDAFLTINRSTLQSNRAAFHGGAIFDIGSATTYVRDSTLRDNSAPHGGAIFEYQSTLLRVERSSILHNNAETQGGGINVGYGTELIIRDSVISFNHSARHGGGIFKDAGLDRKLTSIMGSTFEGNSADWGGGAIFVMRTPLTIGSSTFLQNQAGEYGGGLGYDNNSTETANIRSTTFDGNTAKLDGGAIHFSGERMLVTAVAFRNNQAENGGAIHNAAAALDHYIQRADTTMEIEWSTIEKNTAKSAGGGVYNGGALIVDLTSFTGNESTAQGGGIHNVGTMTIEGSTFDSNSTALDGGGLASVGGNTVLTNDTFSANSASGRGGGIFNTAPNANSAEIGRMQVSHVTVAYNSAATGGGIATSGGLLKIKNSIVALSASGADCSTGGSDFVAVAANLDSDGTCPGFTLKDDPRLEPLADYDGPTWTHALKVDSPAIEAAPDCTTVAGVAVSIDQRRTTRPVGPFCDLGAYEYEKQVKAKATSTPTVTPVPEQPKVTALQNANCRYGPGTAYDIADTLFAGETAPIVGRNEQSTWWQVKGPTFGSLCWVSKVTVQVSGSTEGVPLGEAPPPPTLTPEPHKLQNQPKQGCYVYSPGAGQVCTVPCPPNAYPGGACTP